MRIKICEVGFICQEIGRLKAVVAVKSCQNGSAARRFGMICGVLLLLTGQVGATTPSPLMVGEIVLITDGVFTDEEVAEADGTLYFLRNSMNRLHINTRRYVINKELLFAAGDVFRPAVLDETERNLRNLGFLSEVSVVATDTTSDGRVRIEVRTRDAWTVSATASYSRSSQGETRWGTSLSDGNFLGHGVIIGGGLAADEITNFWHVWYHQRRVFRVGFRLAIDYSRRRDGFLRQLILNHPFYAQDDQWSTEFRVWSRELGQRYYLSQAGPAGSTQDFSGPLYSLMSFYESGVEARWQWRTSAAGEGRVWRFGAGLDVTNTEFREDLLQALLSDGRTVDLSWLRLPGEALSRVEGVEVRPFLWVRTLGRNWAKRRYVLQYGFIEDIPLDWDADLKLGPLGGKLGATAGYGETRWRAEAVLRRWFATGDNVALVDFRGTLETGTSLVRNSQYDFLLGWLGNFGSEQTPWLTRVFAEFGRAHNPLGTEAFVLGLDRGVRTLGFDGRTGDHLMRWNIEQGKATPWVPGDMVRVGVAAFYSGGNAWWQDEAHGGNRVRHELGLGLRFGPTRGANAPVTNVDMSWDLRGSGQPVFTLTSRGFF